MERNEVSIHEARLFVSLRKKARQWISSKEAAESSGISPRTARAHLLKFVKLGIVDVAETFPGHRYKMSEKADKRNQAYLMRLKGTAEVFGLK